MVFTCGCCRKSSPNINRHIHHVLPRALGGSDDKSNLIELCSECHNMLHAIAHKLVSKKSSVGRIQDALSIAFQGNQIAIATCLKLASNVREAMIKADEQGTDENQEVAISTIVKKKVKDLIFLRCKELGIPMNKYLKQLVISDLIKKYPNVNR